MRRLSTLVSVFGERYLFSHTRLLQTKTSPQSHFRAFEECKQGSCVPGRTFFLPGDTAHQSQASRNSRTFDDSGMAQPSALVLGAVQHPLAKLSEAGATIGLSLDQLQALNMPFDWTLAPFEREPGFHSLIVPLKPLSKTLNQTSKEGMRLPSEKTACPSRRTPSAVRTKSGRRQTQRGGKGCWDAEHPDRDWPSGGNASIASQPLLPAETRPRALCARQDHVCDGWRSGGRWRQAHLQALVAHELHAGTPICSPAPIAPEERGSAHLERMQQDADLARLCGGMAIPLTLVAASGQGRQLRRLAP